MNVEITTYKTHKHTLTNGELKKATVEYLKGLVGHNNYLRNEKNKIVVKQDDPYHRHGSISEEYVRDATELDIAVFKVLSLIEKL